MTKEDFPGFMAWVYKKWYFWILVILYSIFTGPEYYLNLYIPEIIGSLFACFLILTLVFIIVYAIAKYSFEKKQTKIEDS